MATTTDVTRAIARLARLYAKELDADTITFIAEVLLGSLTADQACRAIAQWAAKETRWPAPAQLIELTHPKADARDEAAELANRLRTAIARHGYVWESTYRYDGHASIDAAIEAELGPQALAVVQRSGGWARFCKEWGGDTGDTSARAQLREMCGAVAKGAGGPEAARIAEATAKLRLLPSGGK